MKKSTPILFILFCSVFLLAGNASAYPFDFGDGGTALQGVLDGITVGPTAGDSSIDVTQDALPDNSDSYWNITGTGASAATMIIELAGFADHNKFGVYDSANSDNKIEIFAGVATAGDQAVLSIQADGSVFVNFTDTGLDFTGDDFGYYLDSSYYSAGGVWHSDTLLNTDSLDHMAAYRGLDVDTIQIDPWSPGLWTSSEYILAWEDLDNSGADKDYTDFVVMVESITPAPIPEPATLLLLGTGLMGIAGLGRKRKKFSR